MAFDQSQARDSYIGILSQTQFALLSPATYPMQRVGVDNGDGTLSLWWSNAKTWVRLDTAVPRGPSLSGGPLQPWALGGQSLVLATFPGPYSNTGGINTLIGLPGGAPFIPAGLLATGAGGAILRVSGVFTKLGSAGNLNFDVRLGSTNGFGDNQLANFNSSVATTVRFSVEALFTSATTFKTFASYAFGSAPVTTQQFSDSLSGALNTATLPTYLNVGYNSATAPDGAQIEALVVELLMPAYQSAAYAPVAFPIVMRRDFIGMHADPSPV